ncbi:MAG: hypothetical protein RR657_07565 [Peptostreptococcaceae bacterium]
MAKKKIIYAEKSLILKESYIQFDTPNIPPSNFASRSIIAIGNDVYFMGGTSQKDNYKYNIIDNTCIKMTDIPVSFTGRGAVAIGMDIYIFISNFAYKYNTLTNTYTRLLDIPTDGTSISAVVIGTNIYILGLRLGADNYKYDTLTNIYTKMANIPYDARGCTAVAVGTDIYIVGGNTSPFTQNYKYDTLLNTYTVKLNVPYSLWNCSSTIAVGTDLYIFANSETNYEYKAYKYNTLTNTYNTLITSPRYMPQVTPVLIGSFIYLFKAPLLTQFKFNLVDVYNLYINGTTKFNGQTIIGNGWTQVPIQ